MARTIKGKPRNADEALYLLDRGRLPMPKGARTRQEAAQALAKEYGGGTTTDDDNDAQGASEGADEGVQDEVANDYGSWKVEHLREELESRDLPAVGKKADLVARLEEDDEFSDEELDEEDED